MRVTAISDTHGAHGQLDLPDGDVLIHAGDFTGTDTRESLLSFADWLGDLPHRYKLIVAGNHDGIARSDPDLVSNTLSDAGATYLQDGAVTIDGMTFYGSPWTPVFMDWHFMLEREEIAKKWDLIPDDTDVLITHGPPLGFLDDVPGSGPQGCADLLLRLREVRPTFSIFGHIHEHGGSIVQSPEAFEETTLVNASVLDEAYRLAHAPVAFEIQGS